MKNINDVWTSLFSARKLDRDQGVNQLNEFLNYSKSDDVHYVEKLLLQHLASVSSEWRTHIHGALLGCKALITHLKKAKYDETTEKFLQSIYQRCLEYLTYSEVRIRLAAGEVLGSLCYLKGSEVYGLCNNYVLQLIKDNLEHDVETSSASGEEYDSADNKKGLSSTPEEMTFSRRSYMFDDTAGWKCLETSVKCLQYMVDGCGESFKPFITNDFLEFLLKTLSHTNRFVRETGYYVIGSLVSCGFTCEGSSYNPFSVENFGHHLSRQLGIGLSDNWSKVRLASSECAWKFLLSFKSDEEKEALYAELLPKICLNRYIAIDVKKSCEESWRRVTKDNGSMFIKRYIGNFVEHYISQTKSDIGREAACECIAELALKVHQEATKPYVSDLLQAILDCLGDDSLAVRQAAFSACGNFVQCFPDESKAILNQLYPLVFKNLKDDSLFVRQKASGALANVVKAYGMETFLSMKPQIVEGLKGVKNQPPESEKYGQPATFGVDKGPTDGNIKHQPMYPYGSSIYEISRGGGCRFKKPSEPWEFADGCVHLVAELSQINDLSAQVCEMLPLVHEAASQRHYTHHVWLLQSFCKQLPNICKGIGKEIFKQYLELFFDDIFYSLTCANFMTVCAAYDCLKFLSNAFGSNILRARIENFNPKYVSIYDANKEHINLSSVKGDPHYVSYSIDSAPTGIVPVGGGYAINNHGLMANQIDPNVMGATGIPGLAGIGRGLQGRNISTLGSSMGVSSVGQNLCLGSAGDGTHSLLSGGLGGMGAPLSGGLGGTGLSLGGSAGLGYNDYERSLDRADDGYRSARSSDTIIVRNLPMSYTWQNLSDRLKEIGDITEIKGSSTAVIRFTTEQDAQRAVDHMRGAQVDGRVLDVSLY